MADEQKKPAWKTILEDQRRAEAVRTSKLKEARLVRDAALPPPEPKKVARPRMKKPA